MTNTGTKISGGYTYEICKKSDCVHYTAPISNMQTMYDPRCIGCMYFTKNTYTPISTPTITDRVDNFTQQHTVTVDHYEQAVDMVLAKLKHRISKRGDSPHASKHESLGVITEEYTEFIEAVHSKCDIEIANEAVDIAVAAIYTISSMLAKDEIQ